MPRQSITFSNMRLCGEGTQIDSQLGHPRLHGSWDLEADKVRVRLTVAKIGARGTLRDIDGGIHRWSAGLAVNGTSMVDGPAALMNGRWRGQGVEPVVMSCVVAGATYHPLARGVGMRFAASHRLNRPAAAWTGQPTIGQLNRWTDSSSLSGEIETRRGYDTHAVGARVVRQEDTHQRDLMVAVVRTFMTAQLSREFFYKYKTAHVVEQPELRLSFDPWTQKASFSVEFST